MAAVFLPCPLSRKGPMMSKPASQILRSLRRLPALLLRSACPIVGGQAVMEGIMMRHGEGYAWRPGIRRGISWWSVSPGFP